MGTSSPGTAGLKGAATQDDVLICHVGPGLAPAWPSRPALRERWPYNLIGHCPHETTLDFARAGAMLATNDSAERPSLLLGHQS
jgi:hypothetical protein